MNRSIWRIFRCACLFAVLALSDVAHSQQCVPPPSGVIDWWPGDGDASDIEGDHNGTLNNGASFAAGEVGQAFSFDSTQSQYVDVGFIDLPVTYTIDAWIYPTDISNGAQIIGSDDNSNGYFLDFVNTGALRAESIHQTGTGGAQTFYTTVPVITANNWQHVVVTYDGNAGAGQKFKFYVNGAAVPLGATLFHDEGGAPGTSSVTTKIGAYAPFPTFENFPGRIDEVELFNRVLDATEIAAIYNAGSAGQCKSVAALSTSTAIPNGSGNFSSLFRPSFNGSALGFFGTGSGGQQGIYLQDFFGPTPPPIKIADLNTAIPSGTGNFLSFTNDSGSPSDPCISGNNIVFYGTGSSGQRGIYLLNRLAPSPPPIKIADLNTAIPSGTGNFTDFSPQPPPIFPLSPIVSGDNVVFFGAGSGGQQGIYVFDRLAPSPPPIKIADLNTAIPGGSGNFTGFLPPTPISPPNPIVNGNTAAFFGAGSGGQQGIYVVTDVLSPTPPPIKVADLNTAIPGGTGNFTGFPGGPALSNFRLAFIGNGSSSQQGVYLVNDVSAPTPPPIKVADLTTAIPDGTGNFTSFGALSVSATDAAFIGNGSGGQTGIYDQTGGQLRKVITVGQTIGGKTITGLSLNRTGLVADPIAFQATFADGSQGLYVIDVAPVPPLSVVSRKTHGTAGTFDIPLPLTGTPGIECRTGGSSGDHRIVLTFLNPVTVNSASVTSGTGSVSNMSVNGTQVTVDLTGVTNAQTITVVLTHVSDGTNAADISVPMSVLAGDTTANGAVNSSDIAQTQSQSGQTVTASNCREDVTVNGQINSSDIAFVQARSGTALPTSSSSATNTSGDQLRPKKALNRVASPPSR